MVSKSTFWWFVAGRDAGVVAWRGAKHGFPGSPGFQASWPIRRSADKELFESRAGV
jgi:hypothetical protein